MKPRIFLGSTSEGKQYVRSLARRLVDIAECIEWDRGVFQPSGNTQSSLIDVMGECDFVVIILTADDFTKSRGDEFFSPRDNLIFEAGMGFGALGSERTILIPEKNTNLKIPSDLYGFTLCSSIDPTIESDNAIAQAFYEIEKKIITTGRKPIIKTKVGKSELVESAINLIKSADKNIMLFGRDLSWADTYIEALKEQILNGVKIEAFSEKPNCEIAKKNSQILVDAGVTLYQYDYDIGVKFTMIDNEDSQVARFMLAYKERGPIGVSEDYFYHCEFHSAKSSRVMWLTLNRLYKMHKCESKSI